MLRISLLVIGNLSAMPALLLFLMAILAFVGILGDVGPAENIKMGFQALYYAAPFVVVSLICIASFFFTKGTRDH